MKSTGFLARVVWLAAVGLCGAGSATAAEPPPAAEAPEPAEVELGLMSFNIRYGTARDGDNHWDRRKGLVFDLMRESACEIIGLQEALRGQVVEVLAALPAYRDFGAGRDDGVHAGEHASILYDARVLSLHADETSRGTFWLSDTPDVPASRHWGNTIPRVVTFARFVHASSGAAFWVYNTHFDHASAPSRAMSAKALMNHIAAVAGTDPVVVLGDFNAGEGSEPMRLLLGGEGSEPEGAPWPRLFDTFRSVFPQANDVGTFNGFGAAKNSEKIDAVLVTRQFRTVGAAIDRRMPDGRYPSDHWPVTARVRLPIVKEEP